MATESPLSLVSAMITPGILILAAGSLIASTLSRLARVVDRSRHLLERIEEYTQAGDTKRALQNTAWLRRYSFRALIIERTLQAYYGAITLFVASTLAIAVTDVWSRGVWLPTVLVIVGICMVFFGTAALIWEASIAAGGLREEIEVMGITLTSAAHRISGEDRLSPKIKIIRDIDIEA